MSPFWIRSRPLPLAARLCPALAWAALFLLAVPAQARSNSNSGASYAANLSATASNTGDTIALQSLPKQGQAVYELILQGGPFAFEKDGVVFGNYERRLPQEKRGYYHEYTVGYNARSHSRGARRIVCGGWQMQAPEACYYSPDHYNSFLRILPPR